MIGAAGAVDSRSNIGICPASKMKRWAHRET